MSLHRLTGKTALVTGATSGIGYETALGLARLDAHVLLHGRSASTAKLAVDRLKAACPAARVTPVHADMSRLDDVRTLAATIAALAPQLDILVNNAGCMQVNFQRSADGHELQLAVNHLAPYLLTRLLLPAMQASPGSRIIFVTSKLYRFGKINPDQPDTSGAHYVGLATYANTKLCNMLTMRALHRKLGAKEPLVYAVHPGVIGTDPAGVGGLLRIIFQILAPLRLSLQKGARTTVYLVSDPDVIRLSGGYFSNMRMIGLNKRALDPELAEQLWHASAKMVGLPG